MRRRPWRQYIGGNGTRGKGAVNDEALLPNVFLAVFSSLLITGRENPITPYSKLRRDSTRAAEEEFYRLAGAYARHWTRRFRFTPDHADECEQKFVVGWLHKPSDPPRWIWPQQWIDKFLRTTSRNHTLNYLRDVRCDMAHACGSALDPELESPVSVSCPCAIFEDAAMRDLFWHKINAGLRALEPDQYTLIVRGTIEGASIEELSRLFGCTADAMKHRIARARRQLGSILMKREDTEAELRSCLPTHRPHFGHSAALERDDVN